MNALIRRTVVLAAAVLVAAPVVRPFATARAEGQAASAPAATQPHRLTLSPAAVPDPALRYRLLPDGVDVTSGNAAPLYLLATSYELMATGRQAPEEPVADWITMPPDRLPREQVAKYVERYHGALHQVEMAARRDECHWDLPWRQEGFSTLLPHLASMRRLAQALALRARLQILDGRYDDAAHTLQTGFAMAYHLNRDAFLIQVLVGASIEQMMLEQVELWVSTPGSPNLFWALTDLPQPMNDMRSSNAMERASAFLSVPHFREAREGKLTAEQLKEMLDALRALQSQSEQSDFAQALSAVQEVGPAREYLAQHGYTDAQLKEMAPSQELGLYFAMGYDVGTQEAFKWSVLPYYQAAEGLRAADAQKKQFRNNPFVELLVPAHWRAKLTITQPERRVAELRCIEAVRAYAATHNGKPPASLADLPGALPVSIDVVTGKPFAYTSNADGFTLDAPAPAESTTPKDGRRYEATIKKD